ncbi:PREDICTED: cysteine--tRNA ligase 2, cytoplasmic-like isoform X2 [Camelina sativa]|uniref:cysteine--tRNA ligase n=1 Tax=Camelina sativa TaxID=90675 RepID=A0ABM1QDT1_CAMSA|nr:PREDICTED: cysteine--tRNA ligase 2, cytoplasmic-like isoform X2 [Camelina sativa]
MEVEKEKPELTLYNTMTQLKEVLKPINPGKIGMYVCGITSYDFSHLGHARAAVSFDLLYRYLRHLGYEVTYVRNFTDVDDKVIDRANKCGENPLALSSRFCEEYLVDMAALQCLLPTHQPRVSDHMELIIKMIEKIIENGCGYAVGGDVFFSVDKSPNYGQLSGQRLDHTQAGKRVAVDSRKRNPADFALWKAAKTGEPSWESPWGPGRPGWHIECSAMSAHYLSPRFDIHGGGADLKFPHHENEIAQTCAACEDSGTLEDLVKALSPYREEMSEGVGKAVQTAEAKDIIKKVKSEFETKMSNDLNTAHILTGAFQDAMRFINVSITKLKKMQKKQRMSLVVSLVEVEKAVREVLDVLGLLTTVSYAEFLKEMKQKALTRAEMGEEEVLRKIEERKMARKNKEFKRSDKIRESLAVKGIYLEDTLGGTVWRPATPLILKPKFGLGKIALIFAIMFIFVGLFFYSR